MQLKLGWLECKEEDSVGPLADGKNKGSVLAEGEGTQLKLGWLRRSNNKRPNFTKTS
jgi:hypothetical protein